MVWFAPPPPPHPDPLKSLLEVFISSNFMFTHPLYDMKTIMPQCDFGGIELCDNYLSSKIRAYATWFLKYLKD
jgi:hypothetical protein